MGRGRTILAAAAAMAIAAIAAPAAWADVTVTQTDSPDPVDQGGTVTVQTTITNGPTAEPDPVRAHVRMSRPGTQTPVDNTYVYVHYLDRGRARPSGRPAFECDFGAVAANEAVP